MTTEKAKEDSTGKAGTKKAEAKTVKTASLYAALAVFQQSCPAITKEKTAGEGKWSYKYGSLPHIIEAIKPHLKKAGLVFSQPIVTREGVEYIITNLVHVDSSEMIDSKIGLPQVEFKGMNVVQAKGAIITYMRRYALMSILGLVTEEDDTDAAGEAKPKSKGAAASAKDDKPWLNPEKGGQITDTWKKAVKYLADGGKVAEIKAKYRISKANEERLLNEAMTYDDLPFDRQEAEAQEGAAGEQVNMDFENQGDSQPSGREFPPDHEPE